MAMARPREEESKNRSVRLPVRLWELLDEFSESEGKTTNNLLWRMVESLLVERGKIKDSDRKRPPIDREN